MMRRLLDLLVSQGLRRGRQGSPGWLAVAAAAWLWRRSRGRRTGGVTVWSEELAPGETVLISHLDPP